MKFFNLSITLEKTVLKPICKASMDIVFVIMSFEYNDILKRMVEYFGVGRFGTHIGVIKSDSNHKINLNDFTNVVDFGRAVDALSFNISHQSHHHVKDVCNTFFSIKNGGRSGMPKILMFITEQNVTPSQYTNMKNMAHCLLNDSKQEMKSVDIMFNNYHFKVWTTSVIESVSSSTNVITLDTFMREVCINGK